MKIFKRISKYLLWLFVLLLILLIGVYLFIQTETFNKWILGYTIGKLNKSWELKQNNVTAESLNGNILNGIKLNNGAITIKGDTLVSFSYLEVKYDLWSLLRHHISVDLVEINSPRIYLSSTKDKNGNPVWNFANLFSPSNEIDTTPGSPFDWDISVNTFKIDNGYIRVAGDYSGNVPLWKMQREKGKNFNLDNLEVSELWLELNGEYYKDSKSVNINNFSFNTNSDFRLKKLSIDANINVKDTITDIKNFEIETGRTNLKIEKLHVDNTNPLTGFNYEEFGNKKLELVLNVYRFNFADLKYFLPDVNMLDSVVSLSLDASGKYGDLSVNNLNVKLPNSDINLKGKVKHLDNPDSLYLDITGSNLKIYPGDALTVCNIKGIPDYSNLGMVEGNIYFKGTPINFYSEYDLKTGAGYVNGKSSLDINNEIYSGNVTTAGLNLGKILKDNKLNSNLNLTARFDGSGFGKNTISAHVIYSLNNSSIAGYTLSSAGEVSDVRNNLDINIRANSSSGNAIVNGKINIANIENPVYSVKGSVSRLDISGFTKNAADISNINAAFDINGHGSNLTNINGKYNLLVDNSSYSEYRIPRTPLDISINNNGSQSSVKVITDMAEFNATGTFDIASISNAVKYNIRAISTAINTKLNLDSINYESPGILSGSRGGNVNITYELAVKDTAKLTGLTRPFGIVFNGNVNGTIINEPNGFKSTALLNIQDFQYKDSSIILRKVNTSLSFGNDYTLEGSGNSFSPFNITANATGEKIVFRGNRIDSAKFGLNLANSVAGLNLSAKQDSTARGNLAGSFDMTDDKIAAKIDTVFVKYKKYQFANNNNWLVSFLPGKEIEFEQFSIKSKSALANVKGKYSFNAASDVTIESNNLKFADIYSALYPRDSSVTTGAYKYPVDGELTKLSVNYKGTIENPELYAELSTNTLQYDKSNVGTINAKLQYKDDVLTPDILIQNYNNNGNLAITGSMPYKNPFVKSDSSVEFINNPVSLKLEANKFKLDYFTKLVPALGDIDGVINGELTANGTAANPDLTGSLALTNGLFFFPLTGMYYGVNFNVSTANSLLLIDRLSLLNPVDDSRHFDITGNIDFKGLKVNNINLEASGDMVFLDNDVSENELGVYGYIYAGSGNPPITINGNLNKLDIAGQILIKDATISSVPLNGSGYDLSSDNFVYVNESDTSFHHTDSLIAIGPKRYKKINPFDKYKYRLTKVESSVMDFLNLNLNVKTAKNIYASIDFNNITRDRLFGEIQADLNFKTENKVLNAYGNVDVVGNSYYRFYRDFKVNESHVTFNGPISNPVLDIKAVYGGTRVIQQFGTTANTPVQVQLTIKGEVNNPQIVLELLENGSAVGGSDAQGDAVTFLLFGVYKSDLSTAQTTAVASSVGTSVGSLYATSYISQALREVLPFIVDAEFKYNEGDVVRNTDVSVTSEFGDATVKVGSRGINNANYFEFTIDYPLNRLLNLTLPETLLLEISKENLTNSLISTSDVHYSTGLKIVYKFKF